MVIECLGSLASYWKRMKHREPGFLHQPSVKLCFALCSAGHWLKPSVRQEGQRSEVKGQWRAGSSGVSQPLSCSLLPASCAVAMSFWAEQRHNFIPGCGFFFSLSQHCSVVILTLRSAPMILTCFPLRWQIGISLWITGYTKLCFDILAVCSQPYPWLCTNGRGAPATAWADPHIPLHVLSHSQSITTALILTEHKRCIYKETFLGDGNHHNPEAVEVQLGCCWGSHSSWISDY